MGRSAASCAQTRASRWRQTGSEIRLIAASAMRAEPSCAARWTRSGVVHEPLPSAGPDRRPGRGAVFNFTGHRREFPARGRDLEEGLAEEWSGAACLAMPLLEHARRHLAAPPGVEAAVFNRAAAGIVALILAVATGGRLVSVAPRARAHTSVLRGADLAGARLDRRGPEELPGDAFRNASLAVITRVTSELEIMSAESTRRAIEAARDAGCPSLLDDAYGARIGPELLGQPRALELDADLAITSCDKAGLGGPRAGLMAGDPDLVAAALATGSDFGLEARGPIQLGVLRALQAFAPASLRADAEAGAGITAGLRTKFAQGRVRETVMGPTITEADVLSILRERGPVDPRLVPVEATSLLGMVLRRTVRRPHRKRRRARSRPRPGSHGNVWRRRGVRMSGAPGRGRTAASIGIPISRHADFVVRDVCVAAGVPVPGRWARWRLLATNRTVRFCSTRVVRLFS